jgi:histidine phosphotransferase ChpT
MRDIELAELLIARFCHDMAGSVGAINNAVEFLQEEDSVMRQKAFALLEESSKQAVNKLLFYRQAYGITSEIGEANLLNLRQLTENFLFGTKNTLDWPDNQTYLQDAFISNPLGKLILNLIIVATHILIHGGKISVLLTKLPKGKRITIIAKGINYKIDHLVTDILVNNNEEIGLNSKNIQLKYTAKLARMMNVNLGIDIKPEQVELIIEDLKD